MESLLQPENKPKLTQVLTYHVVAGRLDSATLRKLIDKGDGQAMLKTVSGGSLWIRMNGPSNLVVQDGSGRIADISTYDVLQSNGVIHVIDAVVLPS